MDEETAMLSSDGSSKEQWRKLVLGLLAFVTLFLFIGMVLSGVLVHYAQEEEENPVRKSQNTVFECSIENEVDYDPFYSFPGEVGVSKSQEEWFAATESVNHPIPGVRRIFRNATLWTKHKVFRSYDMLVSEDGKIVAIGENLDNSQHQATEIQMDLAHITAGLVDSHNHAGVYSYPDGSFGTSDGNEMTRQAPVYVRAIDGFNADDPAIPLIRNGGITSALVLPGSGTVMGGQAVLVKLRDSYRPSDMVIEGAPRAVKMACGENPKRTFGRKGELPMSRMGIGWVFRERFFKAAQLWQKQEQWRCESESGLTTSPFPMDLELEPLVGILRDDVSLNTHCYKVEDLQMMMRLSKEFDFKITAFHHALEAWKIADEIAAQDIFVATFASHWGFKLEGYDGTVSGPKILRDAGVKVTLKSDHPVIPAWKLIHEAGTAAYYGMDDLDAINAVTSVPAELMGIADQVGSLESGLDADFVVWDRYPLAIGAQPKQVYIDGNLLVDHPEMPIVEESQVAVSDQEPPELLKEGACAAGIDRTPRQVPQCYALVGVTLTYTLQEGAPKTGERDMIVVVENGIVSCARTDCTIPNDCQQVTFQGNGSVLMPGQFQVGSWLGQSEVDSETESQNGYANSVYDQRSVMAVDGVRFNVFKQRHMQAAFAAGVTAALATSQTSALIKGQSGAYYTQGRVITESEISRQLALDLTLGQNAKSSGGLQSAISGQLATLRSLFSEAQDANNEAGNATAGVTDPLRLALLKEIPVLGHVDNADSIAQLLRISQEFDFKLVIYGGAEAHVISDLLAEANVPVILSPPRRQPDTFTTWNSREDNAMLLAKAGVPLGLAMDDAGEVRNLRMEAGVLAARGLDHDVALRSITSLPASVFSLQSKGIGQILEGTPANLAVYSGPPLTFDGKILFVAARSSIMCYPLQYAEDEQVD